MKKSLLLILASLLAVFALAGCAEDSTNDTPALPPVDPALIEQVKLFAEGYYEISFFYTDGAGFMPFSSNCLNGTNSSPLTPPHSINFPLICFE